ncbi:hypothetical protein PseAD21_16590 [Pseudomonas sp. AD21]|nr:hypothetical protein PseAD21_16590 [Pseudomonas sp. AD21]
MAMEPVFSTPFTSSVPALTVAPPMLLPAVSVVVPVPTCAKVPGPLMAALKMTVSLRFIDNVEVAESTITLPVPRLPDVLPSPIVRLPSLTTVFPVYVLLPVSTQVPLPFLASVVIPVPLLPITPATVLLPVLVPPRATVRATLGFDSPIVPELVKLIAPVPDDSMNETPPASVNSRLLLSPEPV